MAKKVVLTDTVRETMQSSMLKGMTAKRMIELVRLLHEFGVPLIEGPWPVPLGIATDIASLDQLEKAQEFYRLLHAESSELQEKIIVFGSTMEKNVIDPSESEILQSILSP